MKKFKQLLLGLTVVCALGLFTACGEVPEIEEDDVMDALEEEGMITDEMDEDSLTVEILETDINDEETKADVTVQLTYEEGYEKHIAEFELKFKINSDGDKWKYRDGKIEMTDSSDELAKGITDEDLATLVSDSWSTIYVEETDKNIYLDVLEFEVSEHDTDLEEKKDIVTIDATAEEGLYAYELKIDLVCVYNGYWSISEIELVESKATAAEGYDDAIKEDKLAEDLKNNSEDVYVAGKYVYFDDLDSFDITVTNEEKDEYYSYVTAEATMSKDGNSYVVEMEAVYSFDDGEKEWVFYYLDDYELKDYTPVIIGTWTGTINGANYTIVINDDYMENDGVLTATVTIEDATGTYSYSASANCYEGDTLYVDCNEWVNEPENSYDYVTYIYGYTDGSTYTDDWDGYTLTKQ